MNSYPMLKAMNDTDSRMVVMWTGLLVRRMKSCKELPHHSMLQLRLMNGIMSLMCLSGKQTISG